jgi:hypothetical protein
MTTGALADYLRRIRLNDQAVRATVIRSPPATQPVAIGTIDSNHV